MAKLYPSLENIQRLKQKPQPGELFIINYLLDNLSDNVEIYFQPFVEGHRPDIVLLEKDVGITIIEVKDWTLSSYEIDVNGNWIVKSNNQKIKSPIYQAFKYKNDFVTLYLDDLLIKAIKNKSFRQSVKTLTYFHNSSKEDINYLFDRAYEVIKKVRSLKLNKLKNISSNGESCYREKMELRGDLELLANNQEMLQIQSRNIIHSDNLEQIKLPDIKTDRNGPVFNDSMYKEFKRFLQPPEHKQHEGKQLDYTKKQLALSESKPGLLKIKGVAGSGKSTVLAKRAVNAHKRHGGEVLILTYNLTLKSFIHDRISDVREDFNWGCFYIDNYHQFIIKNMNYCGINFPKANGDEDLEKFIFSNMNLFKNSEILKKYHSIFVDEIQDYQINWIKILRDYFLEPDGELIVFGDEKQNIYSREMDEEKSPKLSIRGFGTWEKLTKTKRFEKEKGTKILLLLQNFQRNFFDKKYEIDTFDDLYTQETLDSYFSLYKMSTYTDTSLHHTLHKIFNTLHEYDIHQNDVTIIGSNIKLLQDIDFIIRNEYNFKTLSAFESKEIREQLDEHELNDIRRHFKVKFNLNNGMLKLSTTHSFKGFESPTIILFIDEKDTPEIVYTGLSRAKSNLFVFVKNESEYKKFFYNELELI